MIRKFIIKIVIFSLVTLIMLLSFLLVSSEIVKNRNFKNSETESNTLFLKQNKNYDILFLGISHARNFSRHHNHEKVEKWLNKSIVNLAQGEGKCGLNEQLFYLDYFYNQKNKVDTIIYVLTPPLFTNKKLPIASNTFDNEIFDLIFLYNYTTFKSENKYERIVQYAQSKLSKNWISKMPDKKFAVTDSLTHLNLKEVKKGMKLASSQKFNQKQFDLSCTIIEKTILKAKQNNSVVMFIIPPALFGKWNENQQVVDFAKKMKLKYNIKWGDFSEAILEPKYYYDHHHLNTKGVAYFTKKYLINFLKNK